MDAKLHEALAQIAEIRHQMARSELFRGYRAAPAALTGLLAAAAALAQSAWIGDPTGHDRGSYLTLWVGAAAIGALATLLAMRDRRRRGVAVGSREVEAAALEQFAPAVVAGGLLTAVLAERPEVAWMLPGLWQLLFALGLFASSRQMPRPIRLVAAWYFVCAFACLIVARGPLALSPWAMGLPFGVGQAATAAVLHWTLERPGEERR